MPRLPSRLLVPTVSLLALIILSPIHATALPQGGPMLSTAESPEAPGLFSKIWSLLSVVWGETGSALEPNGTDSGTTSGSGGAGDTGSGLDPNG